MCCVYSNDSELVCDVYIIEMMVIINTIVNWKRLVQELTSIAYKIEDLVIYTVCFYLQNFGPLRVCCLLELPNFVNNLKCPSL